MRQQGSPVGHLAVPVKGWVQRFAFVLLVSAAVGLLVLGRIGSPFVERMRLTITDAAAPVLDVLSRPVASAGAIIEEVRQLTDMRGEVVRLRAENDRLRNWQAAARQLRQENAAYRDLLNLVEEPRLDFITARVISDSGGAFVRTVLIAAGTDSGIGKGQAVVNGDGLVGRIVEAGRHSARVLLLTDLNSRIPVVIESTRVSAILAGDNTDRQRLIFMPDDSPVSPGDRIVTSGRGEMLPAGLPIGTVVSVADGVARVQPFTDWHTLEYVRVLEFAYPSPSASAVDAAPTGPRP